LYATNHLDSISTIWYQQGANTIGRVVVPMLDTRFSDGLVAAATHANGMYSAYVYALDDVVAVNEKSPLSISASAYPNPASDVVFIRYQSRLSADMELRIMDNKGALVRKISVGNNSGRNEISLDASLLKTGIYFAVLKTSSGESAMTKFVVAR
jgi:hypothetical protein